MAEKKPKFLKTSGCNTTDAMCDYPRPRGNTISLEEYMNSRESYEDIDFDNDVPPFIPDGLDDEKDLKQSVIKFSDTDETSEMVEMYGNALKENAFIAAQRDIENDDEIDSIRAEALKYSGFY